MTPLSRKASELVREARAQRPQLERTRKATVKNAVMLSVAAGATGTQAAELSGKAVSSWLGTTTGKLALGLTAAAIGSSATVAVMRTHRNVNQQVATKTQQTRHVPALEKSLPRGETETDRPERAAMNAGQTSGAAPSGVTVPANEAPPATRTTAEPATMGGTRNPTTVAIPMNLSARTNLAPPTNEASTNAGPTNVAAAANLVTRTKVADPTSIAPPTNEASTNVATRTTVADPTSIEPPTSIAAPTNLGAPTGDANTRAQQNLTAMNEAGRAHPPSANERQKAPEPLRRDPALTHLSPLPSTSPTVTSTGGSRATADEVAELRDELSALRVAMTHHDAGNDTAALVAVDDYLTKYPAGVMLVEAQVLKVLVLCQLDRKLDAVRVFRELQSQAPVSPTLRRLSSSCAVE